MGRLASACLLALSALPTPLLATETQGHASVQLGWKWLDGETWGDVKHQDEFGACLSIGGRGWPVHIALDVLRSDKRVAYDASRYGGIGVQTYDGTTLEVATGVRKIFDAGTTHPYVGGGLVWIDSSLRREQLGLGETRDADAFGGWLDVGAFWRLGPRFSLGLDLRWSHAESDNPTGPSGPDRASPFPETYRLGGVHGGVTFGFAW